MIGKPQDSKTVQLHDMDSWTRNDCFQNSLYYKQRQTVTNVDALPDRIRLKPKQKISKEKLPSTSNNAGTQIRAELLDNNLGKERTPSLPGIFTMLCI